MQRKNTHSTSIKWSFLAELVLQKDAMRRHAGIRRWVGRRWAEALQEVTSSLTEGDGWPLSKLLHNTGHQSTVPARGTKASTGIQMTPNGKGIDSGRKCNSDSNELLIGENHFVLPVGRDRWRWRCICSDWQIWQAGLMRRELHMRSDTGLLSNWPYSQTLAHALLLHSYLSCFCTINSVHSALNIILPRWEIMKCVYFTSFQTKTGELLTYKQWNPQNKP